MSGQRSGLLANRGFRKLWFGDTVSQFGTQVTSLALPLVAVKTLRATTFEVGTLMSVLSAGYLLIGLPVGVWVDRMRRRPLMIVADLMRAALLGLIPITALTGWLTLYELYIVSLFYGMCTVFFDVAYQSFLPSLVERGELVDGNAKLQASRSVAQVAGPAFGGFLVQLLTAPIAIVADAVSFVVSAGSLALIDVAEPVARVHGRHLRRELGEGLRFVLQHSILRTVAGCTATFNFFSSAFSAVVVVFLVRQIGLSAGVIGVLFSIGSAGAVIGALTATRIARWLGPARAIWLPFTVCEPLGILIALTSPGWGVAPFAAGWFAVTFGGVVYNINQVAYRQTLCPPHLLGRMNATIRFLVWGAVPLGGLFGGALAVPIGNRGALWVAVTGQALSVIWLLVSPLRGHSGPLV